MGDGSVRTISYAAGKVVTEATSSILPVSIDAVEKYYDQRLNVKPYPAEIGHWSRQKLPDSRILYSCPAVDINRLSVVTGTWRFAGAHPRRGRERRRAKVCLLRRLLRTDER